MNLSNVVIFFGMGFAMEVLPRWAADALNSETRLLWLTVMGAVMMMIGGAYLVRMAWETLPREKYYAAVRTLLREDNAREPVRVEAAEKTRARG
jgi:hypothetical protein